ncbi:hypothetical protein [Pseudophaeobacter sp.]|uniref:hypothetical protein n=1 Tax=Pseudophaeobacter sp. TaxID=1971739 RepID=UPI0032991EC7
MKFWELYSICRQHDHLFEQALKEAEDPRYYSWLQKIEEVCATQQRDELDAKLPDILCVQALTNYPEKMFESAEHIRSYKFGDDDAEISYLNVYQMYGGAFLEEVLEKGSMRK